jgi:hypothetical protein
VVPHLDKGESYGASMPLKMVEIASLEIPLASTDTKKKLHSNMEYDQPTMPIGVFYSPHSHDFLDIDFPS